jgi:hypothetical protein
MPESLKQTPGAKKTVRRSAFSQKNTVQNEADVSTLKTVKNSSDAFTCFSRVRSAVSVTDSDNLAP